MSHEAASVLGPGEGRTFSIGTDPTTVKTEGAATGGAFALIESTIGPGVPGPPPHVHRDGLHEFWYLLEGELEFLAGAEQVRARPGSFVHVPPGVIHTAGSTWRSSSSSSPGLGLACGR